MKRGKKYKALIPSSKKESVGLLNQIKKAKELSYSKFDGTIDLSIYLNLDEKEKKQPVRGSISLVSPIKKEEKRILVFGDEKVVKDAIEAGATYAGLDDYIEKINKSWLEFDICLAHPQAMLKIASLGRVLGPRGLMPNPKTGTVTEKIKETIEEYKSGKVSFKSDENGVVHISIGNVNTKDDEIYENIKRFIKQLQSMNVKPFAILFKSAYISATMGLSVKISTDEFIKFI